MGGESFRRDLIGRSVSHYQIVGRLGSGGMGVVYQAEDPRLGRAVAIKFLPEHLSRDPNSLERFRREARAASSLNHPNICVIHDLGEEDGCPFIVMELLQGQSLQACLESRRPSVEEMLDWSMQIADALEAAHEQGIIHRDIKPANIFLSRQGRIKLLDFGIAKLISHNARYELAATATSARDDPLTQAGAAVGTFAYMAPEQSQGDEIDPRADLFSLGVVLYQVATGVLPFQGANAAARFAAIQRSEPVPPVSINHALPPVVDGIILKLLQKNPSQRYQTGAELRRALQRAQSTAADPGSTRATMASPGGVVSATPSSSASGSSVTIAVMPFLTLGTIPEAESLSLGFADALITRLANLEDFAVVPTATVLKYSTATDPEQISQALGMQYVLQGSVQKQGPRWRVSVQLFDGAARRVVFSDKHECAREDLFELQDEISSRVAEQLERRFRRTPRKSRERYSTDPEAYDAFIRGYRASASDSTAACEEAVEQLRFAVHRDPEFALARASLAYVCARKFFEIDPRRNWIEEAEQQCARALEIDPNLGEGHLAKAFILWSQAKGFHHREAIVHLQTGLSLQPNLSHAHNRLGTIYAHVGLFPEAAAMYEKGRRLDPRNQAAHGVTQVYVWSGQYDLARKQVDAWLAEDGNARWPMWFRPQPALLAGDLETASELTSAALAEFPDEPLIISLQGIVHALHGQGQAALECVGRACALPRSFGHTHHTQYQIACIHAVLGELDKAMEWLEESVANGFPCWPFFQRDPALQNLRRLPQFVHLVERLEAEYAPLSTFQRS